MAKYLTFLLFIIFLGCEINSEQLVKSEKFNFQNVHFNAVSKDLKFSEFQENPDIDLTKKLLNNWFNNNIKISGLDGNLLVKVSSIDINKIKKKEYYRFEINLKIFFIETNEILNKKKTYNVNTVDYGEIEGEFSIRDMEILNKNIILKSIKSVSQKLISM